MFLRRLRGLGSLGYITIPTTLAAYAGIEVFVYSLVQLVKLFHVFPAIPGTACYSLDIFWVVKGMYIIYLFTDVMADGWPKLKNDVQLSHRQITCGVDEAHSK